jgi:maltose/maltodextrin transport system substrate-binding protein
VKRFIERLLAFSALAAAGQRAAGAEAVPAARPAEFRRTGWNAMVKQRFMHPPVLTCTPMAGATSYRCRVSWKDGEGEARSARLKSASPEFHLARVWDALPASGPFQVTVEAIDGGGAVLAKAVSPCRRIAPFKGPYRPAACSYDEAGAKTTAWLLKHKPGGKRFPILFYASYIRLLTTYVRTHPKGELAERALAQAKVYGQAMLEGSAPADWTYGSVPMSHHPKVFQVARGGMAGMAYLDLHAATRDRTWLDAATRIAGALKKNQLPDGRWPFRVDPRTGKVLEDYTSDQAEAILLIDELVRNHGREDLKETLDKAVRWMLENPCRTYQWQQQWDDVGTAKPYENLSWYDTALFIEYLLRHATPQNRYEAVARALSRYIEDQFVEWEPVGNQITPGVREQYRCYPIIDWHCAHYVRVCMRFHARTQEDVWLKKARALGDTLTAVQHPDGFYPTWMNHKPSKDAPGKLRNINYGGIWPNCTSYSGEMLLRLGEYVKGK